VSGLSAHMDLRKNCMSNYGGRPSVRAYEGGGSSQNKQEPKEKKGTLQEDPVTSQRSSRKRRLKGRRRNLSWEENNGTKVLGTEGNLGNRTSMMLGCKRAPTKISYRLLWGGFDFLGGGGGV